MNEPLEIVLAGTAGGLLGMLFFGGLWLTIRKGLTSRHAVVWFSGSLILRTGLVLLGIDLIGAQSWQRLASCLFGFVIARLLISVLIKLSRADPGVEPRHAS